MGKCNQLHQLWKSMSNDPFGKSGRFCMISLCCNDFVENYYLWQGLRPNTVNDDIKL